MDVSAGLPFEAVFESGLIGLVPGLQVSITDNVGGTFLAATGAGIVEQTIDGNPNTGIYAVTLTAPPTSGQYTLTWSTDGSFDDFTVTVEGLTVWPVAASLPTVPAGDGTTGPCSLWADVGSIGDCCELDTSGDPAVLVAKLTAAMTAASQVLYFASGRQFAGSCERIVRPCDPQGSCGCGMQVLSRGHLVGWDGDCWGGTGCGCTSVSEIKLAGYVREITEVLIDGIAVDPGDYYVRKHRYLVRKNGGRWPWCQSMDAEDDEPGAFAVTYVYGKTPPQLAQDAALALACEIYKSCTPSLAGECALPTGVTRVTRQGITIERTFMSQDQHGIWRTGIAAVDMFLNEINPAGIPRRGTVWSPSSRARYAQSGSS